MSNLHAERIKNMKRNMDEHIELVKAGMIEKGKDPTPGLWLNVFRSDTKRFNDTTSIELNSENRTADNFKNL